jgi:hypothetical protein
MQMGDVGLVEWMCSNMEMNVRISRMVTGDWGCYVTSEKIENVTWKEFLMDFVVRWIEGARK